MARLSSLIAFLAVAAATAACSSRVAPPAVHPPRLVHQPTTRAERRTAPETPKLVAPPPAYGDEVVLDTNSGRLRL